MRIALIGMPASGKSYWAEKIANRLSIPFFDLDREIEKITNLQIHEIFENFGESFFRETERDTLRKILTENTDFVIATGGGTPIFFDNLDRLNSETQTIYVKENIEILENRLLKQEINRPLFKNTTISTKLQQLLMERETTYQKAQFEITAPSSVEHFMTLIKS